MNQNHFNGTGMLRNRQKNNENLESGHEVKIQEAHALLTAVTNCSM
jgi:hypothetical protein